MLGTCYAELWRFGRSFGPTFGDFGDADYDALSALSVNTQSLVIVRVEGNLDSPFVIPGQSRLRR